jgi:hypothetical protein
MKLKADSEFSGKRAQCPQCKKELVVPKEDTQVSKKEKKAG